MIQRDFAQSNTDDWDIWGLFSSSAINVNISEKYIFEADISEEDIFRGIFLRRIFLVPKDHEMCLVLIY